MVDHLEEQERPATIIKTLLKHAKIQVDQAAKAFEHASRQQVLGGKPVKSYFHIINTDLSERRMLLQEELEQRTVSVSIQAAKLSGRVLRAAIAAVLQKMEQERTMPKSGATA